MFVENCICIISITRGTRLSATKCVNASTMNIIYEFPSEDGEIGPSVPNKSLCLKYRLFPLKSFFFCNLFLIWVRSI